MVWLRSKISGVTAARKYSTKVQFHGAGLPKDAPRIFGTIYRAAVLAQDAYRDRLASPCQNALRRGDRAYRA
jgi:hypothetical protein